MTVTNGSQVGRPTIVNRPLVPPTKVQGGQGDVIIRAECTQGS